MTAPNASGAGVPDLLAQAVARMPDPAAGEQARALDAELAAAAGTRHAVAVSSGTAALHTAVRACGIGPGDEVLVPALTVIMVIAAVALAGAQPVLIDATPDGESLDLDDLAAKVTPRTRAVIPVHFAGRTGNLDALASLAGEHGLMVIEDACQAQGTLYRGRTAGTFGKAGSAVADAGLQGSEMRRHAAARRACALRWLAALWRQREHRQDEFETQLSRTRSLLRATQ